MAEIPNTEDRNIRRFLIAAACAAALGLLTVAITIGVMVACNFNILNWME
ncbi:MAG: hypothetical protein ABI615_12565 [Chthoniobacterales bacterium]